VPIPEEPNIEITPGGEGCPSGYIWSEEYQVCQRPLALNTHSPCLQLCLAGRAGRRARRTERAERTAAIYEWA